MQLNVGPLIQPTDVTQYRSTNRVANPLPPKLFSHNDQQSVWQSNSTEGSTVGWGGRLGDIALSSNGDELAADLHLRRGQRGVRRGRERVAVPDQSRRRDPHQRAQRRRCATR